MSRRIRIGLATVISGAALLGGCADGVEINSPLLDSVGLSTAALSKKEEPKVAPRAPLVMPPSSQRLPEPGQAPGPVVAADPSWPKDRDQERAAAAGQKQSKQAQYCRDGNWKERSMDSGYGHTVGPDGKVCGSIFGFIGDFFSGSSAPEGNPNP